MIHPRTAGLLAALLLSALLLAGCGGGGGEPTVSQGVHDVLQHELDDALAELEAERDAKRMEAAARRTAETRVTRLETQIGNMNDAASNADGASLYAQLNAAKAQVTQLEDVIGAETDAASEAASASLHAQLNAANAEVMRLEGEIGAGTDAADAAGSLHAQLNHATAEAARLNTLIGSMDDAASEAEGASLHAQLNAANAEVMRLEGELTAANTEVTTLETLVGDATNPAATSLRGQIAQLKTDLATAQGRVTGLESQLGTAQSAVTEATERAEEAERQRQAQQQQTEQLESQLTEAQKAELSARATSFGTVLDLGTGDTAEQGAATVSWMRGGSLTFRPEGTLTAGSSAPSVPGGWRSASFTGQTGTAMALVDETVFLYTDIQSPGSRAFWKKYGGGDIAASTVETGLDADDGRTKPSTSVSRTRSDPTDSTSAYVSATTGGTFDGVGGRFSCTGDESVCTVTRSEGMTDMEGAWTFKATNLNSPLPVDEDDAYLYFGIRSSIPDSISGTYDFEYIAGGGAVSGSALAGFDTLTGPATFRGGAVGRYVTQGQVGEQNAKIGTFTATATLNADFGAAGAAGTLSGSITDFREDGSPLTGWSVTLGNAADVGAAIAIAAGGVTGGGTVANIGGLPVGGSWGATFHGSANVITGLADRNKYPAVDVAGVTGWFDATGTNASLAGAFGVK